MQEQFDKKNVHGKPGLYRFSVRQLEILSKNLLKSLGIDTYWLDAQMILSHVLKKSRLEIQLNGCHKLNDPELALFWHLIRRRLCFEPMAYILGHKEFFGRDFFVSRHCLIPRPDTEVIVEKCLSLIGKQEEASFIDLCTGSGVIAISLLCERPLATAVATDISSKALLIAKKNAEQLGVFSRIAFCEGDLFAALKSSQKAKLIIANPPYIGSKEIASLPLCVGDFEPHVALDGGDELGLSFYKRIICDAPNFLCDKGFLVMEIGFNQSDDIQKLLGPVWDKVEVFKDLAGLNRGIILQKK